MSSKKEKATKKGNRGAKMATVKPAIERLKRETLIRHAIRTITASKMTSVSTDSKGRSVTEEKVVPMAASEREFNRSLIGSNGYKTQMICLFNTSIGGTNAVATPVFTADLTTTHQYSSFAALFDEVRCHSVMGRVYAGVIAVGGTWAPNAAIMATACWDPAIVGNLGSLEECAEHTRHIKPWSSISTTIGTALTTGVSAGSGQFLSKDGAREVSSGSLHPDMLPVNSGGVQSPNPVGGNWVPTSDATAAVGYFKCYGEAPGANGAWYFRVLMYFHLEFKCRG